MTKEEFKAKMMRLVCAEAEEQAHDLIEKFFKGLEDESNA